MIYLVFERGSGRVVGHIEASAPPTVLDHHDTIATDSVPDDYQTIRVADGEIVPFVSADYLASLKRKRARSVDDARVAHLAAGMPMAGGRVQADEASRINIAGAVQLAQMAGADFSIDWRLADNTSVSLTGQQMIAIGKAVGEFVAATYARSFALKDAITATSTLAELNALDLSFDVPSLPRQGVNESLESDPA